jgi:hypothetical protein
MSFIGSSPDILGRNDEHNHLTSIDIFLVNDAFGNAEAIREKIH